MALLLGYILAIKTKNINIETKVYSLTRNKIRLLYISLIISIVITILMTIRLSGMSSFSFSVLIEKFISGLVNPSSGYQSKFSNITFGGSLLTYSSVLLSPIIFSSIPLGIFYYKKISRKFDVLVIITIVVEAMQWIVRGTNKGLFDLLIIIFTVVLFKKKHSLSNVYKKKKKIFFIISIIVFACFVFSFFVENISGRIGNNIMLISKINNNVNINTTDGFISYLPKLIHVPIIFLTSYLTQGYYAMSLALSIPFSTTYGIGNSVFLMENFRDIFGFDLFPLTYQSKLEYYGWDSTVNWHSFYTWIANDVHFIGVIFIMLLVGFLLGLLMKDFVINENKIALCLLTLMIILVIYIPANNQVFQSPNTCVAFFILLIGWIIQKLNIRVR